MGTANNGGIKKSAAASANSVAPPPTSYSCSTIIFPSPKSTSPPTYQGRGIGHQLLTMLLENANASYALLSTPEVIAENNNAFHLYRSLGFIDLIRQFYFRGDTRPFAAHGEAAPLAPSRLTARVTAPHRGRVPGPTPAPSPGCAAPPGLPGRSSWS